MIPSSASVYIHSCTYSTQIYIYISIPDHYRLNNGVVRVGEADDLTNSVCVSIGSSDFSTSLKYKEYDCVEPLKGRYITVKQTIDGEVLQVCELEAFSFPKGKNNLFVI